MEIMFGLIIFALIGFIAWREKHFTEERKQLISGILSKDVQEFTIATQVPSKKPEPQIPPEFIPESDLSDDEFFDAIKKSQENG